MQEQLTIEVPYGTCHCGCGEKTEIVRENRPALGLVKGQPRRFILNHHHRLAPVYYRVEDRGYKTPCWVWQLHTARGYGYVSVRGENRRAHRVYYERAKGPIPAGLEIDHLCRVPTCVNPDHLEPVTRAEHNRRGNNISAVNGRKTHCPQGHEYTSENTYIWRGCRHCRTCGRLRAREYKRRST